MHRDRRERSSQNTLHCRHFQIEAHHAHVISSALRGLVLSAALARTRRSRTRGRPARQRRLDFTVQRQGPGRLETQDQGLRSRRQFRQHVPRRGRRPESLLRPVFQVRRQVRAPLLQDAIFPLQAAHRVSLRRRPVPRRAELGVPQQRRDDPRPVARIACGRTRNSPSRSRSSSWVATATEQAPDRQRLHAGHEHRDERQAHHAALHQFAVQDLSTATSG